MKSFRNSLLVYNLHSNGVIITNFSYIASFYFEDKVGFLKLAPKLSDKHIEPKQKIKVKLATQLLSHTVAAVLRSAVELKQLNTDV